MRVGDWKLHLRKGSAETLELYNLSEDAGETDERSAREPEIVTQLFGAVETVREDPGDAATGQPGACRPIGRVPAGRALTECDSDHPYYMAEYDLAERG